MPSSDSLGILFGDQDADLTACIWRLDKDGYARRTISRKPLSPLTIKAHVEVFERKIGRRLVPGELIDHRDQNKLNNQRDNLRLADKSLSDPKRDEINGGEYRSLRSPGGWVGDLRCTSAAQEEQNKLIVNAPKLLWALKLAWAARMIDPERFLAASAGIDLTAEERLVLDATEAVRDVILEATGEVDP